MAIKFNYYGLVDEEGKLPKSVANNIRESLASLKGKRVSITVEKVVAKRSAAQNNYLHFLFGEFANGLNALGNHFSKEEVKELLKAKFAMIDMVNEESGEVIGQRIQNTSEMNKEELSVFVDEIIRYGAEFFNLNLPYPGEILTIDFED